MVGRQPAGVLCATERKPPSVQAYRHRLGTPAEKDHLVYEEKDPGFFLGVGITKSDRFIVINSHDHETSEVECSRPMRRRCGPG